MTLLPVFREAHHRRAKHAESCLDLCLTNRLAPLADACQHDASPTNERQVTNAALDIEGQERDSRGFSVSVSSLL
ncbi:hypothetical protein OPQ81_011750 [Rhizoctonia solani]|nr:hypothetical protein OPQ81_011750 [Rhizoctonia solani]